MLAAKCEVDCRLCTTLIEVCGRKGDTDRALQAYAQVRAARAVCWCGWCLVQLPRGVGWAC